MDEFTLSQDILGQDCALNFTNIDSICKNLNSFLLWAYEDCQENVIFYYRVASRLHVLLRQCHRIEEIQARKIHPNRRN